MDMEKTRILTIYSTANGAKTSRIRFICFRHHFVEKSWQMLCVIIAITIVILNHAKEIEAINRMCLVREERSQSSSSKFAMLNAFNVYSMESSTVDRALDDNAIVSMAGVADISKVTDDGKLQITSNMNVTTRKIASCPSLEDAADLTQTQLISKLTNPCRYDRFERPKAKLNGTFIDTSVAIYVRAYIYVFEILDSSNLQFKIHGLLQLRYADERLAFGDYAPNRKQPILGESQLRQLLWVPHIFLANEHDSSILGTNEMDILTSISPDGMVVISSRFQATLYCWMNLKKFPFDEQRCTTILESWMYNASQLQLHWEEITPITFDPRMHLSEFDLQSAWSNESVIVADPYDLRRGVFAGNYSTLTFTVHLTREVGYYVMDYFLPSMMIVSISWVSFWLQADQTPARTTLGTSTLLSFITLSSSQEKNLPKVSYIKISEVWFLGCTLFIFGSLIEFAFVNTIWRRNRSVELKKKNSKYILKSTLTPSMNRRIIQKADNSSTTSIAIKKTSSSSNINNFLTVDTPVIMTDNCNCSNDLNTASVSSSLSIEDNVIVNGGNCENKGSSTWSTMTPHEVSLWIDRKARFAFPLAFILFNAFFWTVVYCL